MKKKELLGTIIILLSFFSTALPECNPYALNDNTECESPLERNDELFVRSKLYRISNLQIIILFMTIIIAFVLWKWLRSPDDNKCQNETISDCDDCSSLFSSTKSQVSREGGLNFFDKSICSPCCPDTESKNSKTLNLVSSIKSYPELKEGGDWTYEKFSLGSKCLEGPKFLDWLTKEPLISMRRPKFARTIFTVAWATVSERALEEAGEERVEEANDDEPEVKEETAENKEAEEESTEGESKEGGEGDKKGEEEGDKTGEEEGEKEGEEGKKEGEEGKTEGDEGDESKKEEEKGKVEKEGDKDEKKKSKEESTELVTSEAVVSNELDRLIRVVTGDTEEEIDGIPKDPVQALLDTKMAVEEEVAKLQTKRWNLWHDRISRAEASLNVLRSQFQELVDFSKEYGHLEDITRKKTPTIEDNMASFRSLMPHRAENLRSPTMPLMRCSDCPQHSNRSYSPTGGTPCPPRQNPNCPPSMLQNSSSSGMQQFQCPPGGTAPGIRPQWSQPPARQGPQQTKPAATSGVPRARITMTQRPSPGKKSFCPVCRRYHP